ncbi:hypothetical protein JH06_5821 [Blastocystis sp. subtype 4]|uniref:hypothetical protein n=1 Tax=Blastocystis sp. subtype 4 TaxID=944170 RepID=UPI00071158F5|nr:hypothetical protein JH06_5821 [Blastocystis sp. subtype 4]KNB43985.1 hypothetical protein JH06_5821 [Blastocystis sp. subtype 4]|eukprot:XP_014527430.1 hypothetical protein JH06_5821 [Blastocystis sp. subtype 4]
MDSWSEKEIKAMQVGGNKQLRDFFSSHGISNKSSIKKKYNSSAAAIQAKVDGREPPSELSQETVNSESDEGEDIREEDPIQREIRLRAEAKERLQKKFGAGGLGSQAVGSSPIPPGGYGNQPQNQTPSWATDDLTKTLASIGQGVSKSLESGVNSVRTKLNDPNLQKEVKEKAAAGWSWLSSTATTLWSAAKETASTIASELADDGTKKPNSPRPSVPAA